MLHHCVYFAFAESCLSLVTGGISKRQDVRHRLSHLSTCISSYRCLPCLKFYRQLNEFTFSITELLVFPDMYEARHIRAAVNVLKESILWINVYTGPESVQHHEVIKLHHIAFVALHAFVFSILIEIFLRLILKNIGKGQNFPVAAREVLLNTP